MSLYITLLVKTLAGAVITLDEVQTSDSIATVKAQAAAQLKAAGGDDQIPDAAKLTIVFNRVAKSLDEKRTVAEYNLQTKSTLHVAL